MLISICLISSTSKTITLTAPIVFNSANSKTYTISAKERQTVGHDVVSTSRTSTIYWYNRRYYGATTTSSNITAAELSAMTSQLMNSRGATLTINGGTIAENKYIWIAYPTRLGAATFKVGGFEGGFEPAETVSVANMYGISENYYAYRSTNPGLGSTTITIS